MKKIRNIIYIIIGIMSFALGAVGVILPILPTTPFLLLSSFCFVRGSEKFNSWFTNTKIYKKHLEEFVQKKCMTLRKKVCILLFADTMMMIPFIKVDNLHMRIAIIIVVIIKLYYFTFKIETVKR